MIVDEYRMSNDAEALLRSKMSNVEFNDVAILKARDDFYLFRQQIRKDMIWGWWTQEVAWQLQRFYNDMVEGKRPKLAISAPPQHGKSWAATSLQRLPQWLTLLRGVGRFYWLPRLNL